MAIMHFNAYYFFIRLRSQIKQRLIISVFSFQSKAKDHELMDRSFTGLTESLKASVAKDDGTLASSPQWLYLWSKCYNFISCANYSDNPSCRIIAPIKNVYSFPKSFSSHFKMKQLRVISAL